MREFIKDEQTSKEKGRPYYFTKCPDCGAIRSVRKENVGTRCKDCAYKTRKKANNIKDITGQTFGYLTVIEKTDKRIQRKVVWKCKCICGKEIEVLSTNLTSGRTKSCGCKTKELIGQHTQNELPKNGTIINGTEILDSERRKNNREWNEIWVKCKCKFCGDTYWTRLSSLKSEITQSCGCVKSSLGEAKIEKLLKENNYIYEREKIFSDCYFSDIHNKSRFDFFVNNSYLIEYDGVQHFIKGNGIYDNEKQFKLTQQRDAYKNNWCKEYNIPLIRIPYTHYNNLKIEDLDIITTQFKVV